MFAEIQSSNIVGYQGQDLDGLQYNSVGATFIKVGSEGKFKLGDIKPEGFSWSKDFLQVLSTTSAETTDKYIYIDAAADAKDFEDDGMAIGWWVKNADAGYEEDGGIRADNLEFDAGQGFLGNFPSKAVKFTYAGQVVEGKTQLDSTGKQYNMIANFLPIDIKLGQVEAINFSWSKDFLQVLSTTSAETTDKYIYIDAAADANDFEDDGKAIGWWVKNADAGYEEDGGIRADEFNWKAGKAFLSNFPSKAVKLNFPSAL